MKQAKKLSLITLHDYPRDCYSAYWEIMVVQGNWLARLYSYEHKPLEEATGISQNEEEARRDSQTWIISKIENYRRPEPLKKMTPDLEKEWRDRLKKATDKKEYGRVDTYRGLLKAYGKWQ